MSFYQKEVGSPQKYLWLSLRKKKKKKKKEKKTGLQLVALLVNNLSVTHPQKYTHSAYPKREIWIDLRIQLSKQANVLERMGTKHLSASTHRNRLHHHLHLFILAHLYHVSGGITC